MWTRALLTLAALSATASRGARIVSYLPDTNLNELACPSKVDTVPTPSGLLPREIKVIQCDWDAIKERDLQGCVEVHDEVLLFRKRASGGRPALETGWFSVGCVQGAAPHSSSMEVMPGD